MFDPPSNEGTFGRSGNGGWTVYTPGQPPAPLSTISIPKLAPASHTEATVDPPSRGPDWMAITPKTGSLFHAYSQNGRANRDDRPARQYRCRAAGRAARQSRVDQSSTGSRARSRNPRRRNRRSAAMSGDDDVGFHTAAVLHEYDRSACRSPQAIAATPRQDRLRQVSAALEGRAVAGVSLAARAAEVYQPEWNTANKGRECNHRTSSLRGLGFARFACRATARNPWFRDHILCESSDGGSIPRERVCCRGTEGVQNELKSVP
jgi:hypothetical protein